MLDLSGLNPSQIPFHFPEVNGERKAILNADNSDEVRIDSRTFWGILEVLRQEKISILKIGDTELKFKDEPALSRIAATRSGIDTALKCSIPKGGVHGQIFSFFRNGKILLDRGNDALPKLVQLFPLPDQTLSIKRTQVED